MASSSPRSILICLFRYDLRVHDNPILHAANTHPSVTHVLPLYVFDQRIVDLTAFSGFEKEPTPLSRIAGFRRCGQHRTRFLWESVNDLQQTLRKRGSELVVRLGEPEKVIIDLVKSYQQDGDRVLGVYMQKEPATEEVAVENRIKRGVNIPVHFYHGASVVHPDDLPFPISKTPDVYTQFRKQAEGLGEDMVRPLLDVPERLKPVPDLPASLEDDRSKPKELLPDFLPTLLKPIIDLDPQGDTVLSSTYSTHPHTAFPFDGGETAALRRLSAYCFEPTPSNAPLQTYKQTRNGLLGERYSTKLSPYLAHGCISPKFIYHEVQRSQKMCDQGATQDNYWVIFELLWRDYFRAIAEKYGSALFWSNGLQGRTDLRSAADSQSKGKPDSKTIRKNGEVKKPHPRNIEWKRNDKFFKLWQHGQTGVPFIDANMREVLQTGFMSNRGRQNIASFFTKDLYLDWRIGAEWFESVLLDYDPASNYGNWQYVAGIGNDPRGSRKFNIIKQSHDYDPLGDYVSTWIPELKSLSNMTYVHTPWKVKADEQKSDYPTSPIVIDPEWEKHAARRDNGRKGRSNPNEKANGRPWKNGVGGVKSTTGRNRGRGRGRGQSNGAGDTAA